MSRLQRYRKLMRTLDPSGDPAKAVANGWDVDRPRALTTERIARRIELEPGSLHLLLGGIGSGKTTELWRIHRRLRELGNDSGDSTHYIDVASYTRLDTLRPGILLALVGKRLANIEPDLRKARGEGRQPPAVTKAVRDLRELAEGYTFYAPVCDDYDDDYDENEPHPGQLERVKGVVDPPERPLEHALSRMISPLRILRDAVVAQGGHCVVLLDSLDRAGCFEQTLRDDIRVLRKAGIGMVVVGPLRLQYTHAEITVLFEDNVHSLPEVVPEGDGLHFLLEVLSRRATTEVLPPQSCHALALASGGVLRDLIALAKSSAQEAYLAGSDVVNVEHVSAAAQQFGRTRVVGIDGAQVEVLKKVLKHGTLVIGGKLEVALLETRRVLDYGGGRFVVHPTLVPLLEHITVAA